MKTFFISLITVFALVLGSASSFAQAADIQKDNLYPRVKFVTNKGSMIVELDRWRAPVTVDHFLTHVVSGSYDSTLFHRVVKDFVVQGGGYKTDWTPLPEGDTVFGRVVENEELLRELMAVETDFNEEANFPDVPVEPLVLMRVELLPEPQVE